MDILVTGFSDGKNDIMCKWVNGEMAETRVDLICKEWIEEKCRKDMEKSLFRKNNMRPFVCLRTEENSVDRIMDKGISVKGAKYVLSLPH